MRIVITGGAGCLGSNLIDHYLPHDHEICIIDNFVTGKKEFLPNNPRLSIIEASIINKELVEEIFSGFRPTHVIHAAASYKDPLDWIQDIETNLLGTINVANAAMRNGVYRFINLQTALCYGRTKQCPIPIDHPLAPFTSYGISKTAGEQYLLMSGLPVISLRLANICGPRLAIGPIPIYYKRLKEGLNCYCSDTVRDFMDISDFFSLMDLALSPHASTGVFNVSTGKGHSILEVFQTVAEYLSLTRPEVPIVPPSDDDVPVVVLDPSKTEEVFSWHASVDFKETIQRQLAWYDDHGVNDIYSHLLSVKKP